MKHRALALAVLIAVALPQHDVRAQQVQPIVRATIDPSRVVVGQQTTLRIVVLAPNYMTSPPELPGFQLRNAVTRQLQSLNTSEEREGVSYAGIRFDFAVFPLEAGSYAIADQTVRIKYAAEPPATREVVVALPQVSFEAFIPESAAALRPFLSASRLTASQEIKRSSDQLKAGDAVTRTVTIRAEGTPAMLLPPQKFVAIDGLRLYPAQPVLEDRTEARSDVISSTRVDSTTYMLERPGNYALPAIDIGWFNVGSARSEIVHLDPVSLNVAANPAIDGAARIGPSRADWTWDAIVEAIAEHWPVALLGVVAIAGVAWFMPSAMRRAAAFHRRRRLAYLQSEAWAFRQLRAAARHRNASATYFRLLGWLQRFEPIAPAGSIEALTLAARDPVLEREIGALQHELFAPDRGNADWSRHTLIWHLSSARTALRRRSRRNAAIGGLPQELNPVSRTQPASGHRRVAR